MPLGSTALTVTATPGSGDSAKAGAGLNAGIQSNGEQLLLSLERWIPSYQDKVGRQ